MSLDLAYLVIDRAPLRGVRYWTLLYVALAANERDITYASGPSVSVSVRCRRQRAQEALAMLCAEGYLKRLRYGQPKNRYDGYYIVLREKLIALPSQHRVRQVFAGQDVNGRERTILDETAGLLAERAVMLERFLALKPGEHRAFLERAGAKNSAGQ